MLELNLAPRALSVAFRVAIWIFEHEHTSGCIRLVDCYRSARLDSQQDFHIRNTSDFVLQPLRYSWGTIVPQ